MLWRSAPQSYIFQWEEDDLELEREMELDCLPPSSLCGGTREGERVHQTHRGTGGGGTPP